TTTNLAAGRRPRRRSASPVHLQRKGNPVMLVLSRRLHEKILIPGMNIAITVVGFKPGQVRLGIEAPPEVTVLREEVPDRVAEWGTPNMLASCGPSVELRLRKMNLLLRTRLRA